MTVIARTALALAAAATLAGPALAAGYKHRHQDATYSVKARTLPQLVSEMNSKGPNGYWGYATWYIRWTGTCEVSLETRVTLPKHAAPKSLAPADRAKWTAMVAALAKHEKGHVSHGMSAAKEIADAGCRNADRILSRWQAQDVKYDKKTDHGRKDGVILR